MINDEQVHIPLRDATEQVAGELDALEHHLESIEGALEGILESGTGEIPKTALGMLQELDILRQSVGSLSGYLSDLSKATNASGFVNPDTALQRIPLRELASKLSGRAGSAPVTGLPELF